jgi:hypothetical protein
MAKKAKWDTVISSFYHNNYTIQYIPPVLWCYWLPSSYSHSLGAVGPDCASPRSPTRWGRVLDWIPKRYEKYYYQGLQDLLSLYSSHQWALSFSSTWADVTGTDGKFRGNVMNWREQGHQRQRDQCSNLDHVSSLQPMISLLWTSTVKFTNYVNNP